MRACIGGFSTSSCEKFGSSMAPDYCLSYLQFIIPVHLFSIRHGNLQAISRLMSTPPTEQLGNAYSPTGLLCISWQYFHSSKPPSPLSSVDTHSQGARRVDGRQRHLSEPVQARQDLQHLLNIMVMSSYGKQLTIKPSEPIAFRPAPEALSLKFRECRQHFCPRCLNISFQ